MIGLTMVQRQAVTKTNATRYKRADKTGKGLILDELCATTGWHRNHARKATHAGADASAGPAAGAAAAGLRGRCHCRAGVLLGGAGRTNG